MLKIGGYAEPWHGIYTDVRCFSPRLWPWRMSSRPRPRSASLKALPPDQPVQAVEVQNISPAVHWSVNPKERPRYWDGEKPGKPRPLKSVSLKLAKGDGSPTASTRSNSAGAAWGSGELLIDGRQCIKAASGAIPGPPSRGTEADKAGRSRPSALPRSEFGETPVKPPGLPKASAHQPTTSSYPSRPTAAIPDDDEAEASRPSSASYQRAAAIYASLPKTPGGTRTLVRDADGFIFRPSVEAEVKAAPQRLRPGSRGLNELVASLTKKKPREDARPAAEAPEAATKHQNWGMVWDGHINQGPAFLFLFAQFASEGSFDLVSEPSHPVRASPVLETRDQIAATFETCPHYLQQEGNKLSGSSTSGTDRVRRAWLAGQWASAVVAGRIHSPNRSPQLDLRPRFYVVLRAPSLEITNDCQTSSAISQAFPSEQEAKVYLAGAGISDYDIKP
eukprot:s564_g20.t1